MPVISLQNTIVAEKQVSEFVVILNMHYYFYVLLPYGGKKQTNKDVFITNLNPAVHTFFHV